MLDETLLLLLLEVDGDNCLARLWEEEEKEVGEEEDEEEEDEDEDDEVDLGCFLFLDAMVQLLVRAQGSITAFYAIEGVWL